MHRRRRQVGGTRGKFAESCGMSRIVFLVSTMSLSSFSRMMLILKLHSGRAAGYTCAGRRRFGRVGAAKAARAAAHLRRDQVGAAYRVKTRAGRPLADHSALPNQA